MALDIDQWSWRNPGQNATEYLSNREDGHGDEQDDDVVSQSTSTKLLDFCSWDEEGDADENDRCKAEYGEVRLRDDEQNVKSIELALVAREEPPDLAYDEHEQ
jgi:hypothetical protein